MKEKVWVKTESGGYWSYKKADGRLSHKLPMFCPREECNRITSTIDDEYILKYGVCSKCYVHYVDGREKPLIDVDFYVKRLKERGY